MNYRLQIIFPEGRIRRSKKVRYCDVRRIPCQIGCGKYSNSRHAGIRLRHEISAIRQGHGGEILAHAFRECRLPEHEYRDVRAQRQGQRHEFAPRQARPPQFVQRDQHRRSIAGAAAQAAALRNPLFQGNLRALARASGALQRMGRAQGQIIRFGYARQIRGATDDAVGSHIEMQRVAKIDETEDRLQQVIAVSATAHHMQEQVQLGWRGNIVQSHRRQPVRDKPTF